MCILNCLVTVTEQFNRIQLWSVAAMIFGDYVLLPQTLTRGLTVSLYFLSSHSIQMVLERIKCAVILELKLSSP
jgi:hypothetical protein